MGAVGRYAKAVAKPGKGDELAQKLGVVARAVSARASVQILSGVLLRAEAGRLHLAATDMELSLRSTLEAQVDGEGSIVVPGRLLVDLVRMPAIIATLATLSIYSGLQVVVSGGSQVYASQLPSWLAQLYVTSWLGIQSFIWIAAVCVVVFSVILRMTRWGRDLYAMGSNPEAAHYIAIPIRRRTYQAFTVCGALAGLGGECGSKPVPEERVVGVRSVGPVFCAWMDRREMRERLGARPQDTVSIAEVLEAVEHYPLPVVAVVQGDAIAGGNELAMHCDLVVAATNARAVSGMARSSSDS